MNAASSDGAVGATASRPRREDLDGRWQRAIEEDYLRLETGLLERTNSLFAGEKIEAGDEDPLVTGLITVGQAMRLWFHHRQHAIDIGSPHKRREMPIEEVRAEIMRRVENLTRKREMPEEEMARARRAWKARRRAGD